MKLSSRIALVDLVAALAAAAFAASGWRPDNRIASWVREGEGAAVLERIESAYGGDEFLLVRVEHGGDPGALAFADRAGKRLADAAASARVLDPLRLPGTGDAFRPAPRRLDEALERPVVRELSLASPDHVDLVVRVDPEATREQRADLAGLVAALHVEAAAEGAAVLAAGHTLVTAALDAEALRVDRSFAPLLFVLAVLLLAAVQRSLGLALAVTVPAALASTGTRAVLHAIGWPANLVLVAAGPLVFVIVLAASLHYASAFRRGVDAGLEPDEAARAGLREVLVASLLAALTTALGFGVFATSDVQAVRRLGLAAAGGIALGAPLALVSLRVVLAGLRVPRRPLARTAAALEGIAARAAALRVPVLVLAAAVVVAAVFGVRVLRPATNALVYFPETSDLREAFVALEARGVGLSSVELLVEGVPSEELARGDLDERLATVSDRVLGPELVRRDLEAASGNFARFLEEAALRESGRAPSAGPPGGRWTVFLPTTGAERTRALADRVRSVAEAAHPGAEVRVGGSLLGALDMQAALLTTLSTSLALTALVTGALFLLVTRSPRVLAVAFAVNSFPVAVALATNAATVRRLDASTVMVAAVVLGLAVDNTLHLLHAGRRDPREAFARVAEPAALGGMALALGFASLALSGFAPTAHFGLLVAAGVVGALFGDFALLPALWLPRRAPKR